MPSDLEGIPNIENSKSDFKEWPNKTYLSPTEKIEYTKKHFIPQGSFEIKDFLNF